jgi:beta-lactamase regulating signal transducer with metallopeptidase domain
VSATLVLRIAALASDVLHAAWAELVFASVVCAVVWLVCRTLGDRWLSLQQALWVLVLVRLVLPPGLAQPYGAGALLDRLGLGYPWSDTGDPVTSWLPAGESTRAAASRATPIPRSDTWALPVLFLWVLGVTGLFRRDTRRARHYRRILREASPVQDAVVLRTCDEWRRRLGIRRRVQLVTSDARVAPFTAGLLRPVVFLPSALLAHAHSRGLATALAHELGHVARCDSLWMRLQQGVQRLYFFHPAVWLVSHRLRAGREQLCDALGVARGLATAQEYAHGLLDVLELNLRGVSAPALTPTRRRIAMRIHTVLSANTAHRSRRGLVWAVAVIVGSFLLPLASANAPREPSPISVTAPQGVQAEPEAPESSTLHWAHGLANPLPGGLLRSGFGKRPDPMTQHQAFHSGIDLSAPLGTPVLAPSDGRVSFADQKGGYGNALILVHAASIETRYAHLQGFNVRAGQRVQRGDVIATVGETGRSVGGAHLHYEVWIRNEMRNPIE